MGSRQDALVYIEKNNITEAEFMSRSFVDTEIRNRAYINALGAELVMKYLSSEGIKIENVHNLHSVSKILEKYDIADILLPNIHIDARVVFDEKYIFIPKSHYEMEITPDIYVILKLDSRFEHVELLGFIEADKVGTKNANSDYYFVPKRKLTSIDRLKTYIKNFTGSTSRDISEEDFLTGRQLSVALADHNLSVDEEKELFELLFSNDALRESVLEFDNFETLAYNVVKTLVSRTSQDIELIAPVVEDIHADDVEEETKNEEIDLSGTSLGEDDIVLDETFFDNNESEQDTEEETQVEDSELEQVETESELEVSELDETVIETETEEEEQNLELIDENEQANLIDTDVEETAAAAELDVEIPQTVEEADAQTVISDEVEALPETELQIEEELLPESDLSEDLLAEDAVLDEQEAAPVEDVSMSIDEDIIDEQVEQALPQEQDIIEETLNLPEEELSLPEEDLLIDDIEQGSGEDEIEDISDEGSDLEPSVDTSEQDELQAPIEEKTDDISKGLAQTISDAVQNSLEKGAKIAASAASAGIAGAAGATAAAAAVEGQALAAGAAATEEAIKLASVSGDVVSNVVEKNVEKQQKRLDRIDYAKTDITPDVAEIPEHIAVMDDLSIAKMQANLEAEQTGQYQSPTDLTELKKVEDNHEEEIIEQETIDLGAMDTVENENFFTENSDEIVNLSSINANSPTKPSENLHEIHNDDNYVGMDLPDLSSYTINEDGTSNMDNFAPDLNFDDSHQEQLMDFKMNELSLDDDISLNNNDLDSDELSTTDSFGIGDKIITETLDQDTNSDFDGGNDFSGNEIINMDEDALELDDVSTPLEQEIIQDVSEEAAQEDFITMSDSIEQNDVQEFSGDIEQEEVSAEELFGDDGLADLIDETPAQEFTPQEFASGEEASVTNEELLSADEFSDSDLVELPQDEQPENLAETAQDWVEDTNYDDLADVEPQNVSETVDVALEEMIVEPELNNQKVFAVVENSRVISDRNYTVGEIPIDINNSGMPQMPENESLESLYNEDSDIAGGALLQTPGRLGTAQAAPKSGFGFIVKLAGMLIALAIVCVIGFNVAKLFKAPAEEAPQPVTDDALPTAPQDTVVDNNNLDVNPDNVVNMDNTTNTLANPETLKKAQQQAAQTPAPAASTKKQSGSAFLEISKLTWEVPDYVSYNPQFKQYFQAAGKSVKLSLTSDLLLATDYAYSNEVRVSVTYAKDGTFKNASILKSSGSTQIDNIVLQTVNQTLKALKAPQSVGNDESTTAILKIYF